MTPPTILKNIATAPGISSIEESGLFLQMSDQILILDFGSQYTQLIARRVRELNVYCEIHPFNKVPALTAEVKGVILSGSPCSVRDPGAPSVDLALFKNVPLLGVCYGAQLIAQQTGGSVMPSLNREYGRAKLATVDHHNELLKEISVDSQVWMSHADTIMSVADDYEIIASTSSVKIAAFRKELKMCNCDLLHRQTLAVFPTLLISHKSVSPKPTSIFGLTVITGLELKLPASRNTPES